MTRPRVGSLCSRYGGLELGLMSVVGGSVAWHAEIDRHPSAVLDARFPGVPNLGDITTTDWSTVEPVDWFTAGYPCQPFSHAGKRKGKDDERHLWPFVADAISALRPRRVFLENVAGHVSLGLDAVLWDLAALGYDATWGVVRAADTGACHGRARLFILAADARRERHGSGEDSRSLGRVDSEDAGEARQWQRPRPVVGDRSATIVADSNRGRFESRPDLDRDEEPDAADGDSRRRHVDGRGNAAAHADESRREGPQPARGCDLPARCAIAHTDAERRERGWHSRFRSTGPADNDLESALDWGAYDAAIRRWERTIRRPAPRPTELNTNGKERLSACFVEWMMGLPDGWVTDVLPRNPALKCLGNGVVPQQAAFALRLLLPLTVTGAAA